MADRNLVEVIDAMLAVVPPGRVSLEDRLESIRDKAMYAPEIMSNNWHATHAVLIDEIGEPTEDWQRAGADIFSGRRAS